MPYNISEAFEKIEDELIGSMVRNLSRHKAEETERGYNWTQWQALQLRSLEEYRKNNQKKFPQRFNKLNVQIRETLQDSYNDGSTKQEQKILQAIEQGFKGKGCSFPKWIKVQNSLISTLMSHITRILMIWLSFFKMLAFSSIMVYNVYNYSTYEVDNHDRYATEENDHS